MKAPRRFKNETLLNTAGQFQKLNVNITSFILCHVLRMFFLIGWIDTLWDSRLFSAGKDRG